MVRGPPGRPGGRSSSSPCTGARPGDASRSRDVDEEGVGPAVEPASAPVGGQRTRPSSPNRSALSGTGVADRPARHQAAISSKTRSRRSSLKSLESRRPLGSLRIRGRSTATPTVSGPAQAPRPTSSSPATTSWPAAPQPALLFEGGRCAPAGASGPASAQLMAQHLPIAVARGSESTTRTSSAACRRRDWRHRRPELFDRGRGAVSDDPGGHRFAPLPPTATPATLTSRMAGWRTRASSTSRGTR